MSLLDTFVTELVKSVPGLIIAIVTLSCGWLIGQRVAVRWNVHQKKKELDLLTAQEFSALYGEFFTVWKLWNYYIRDIGSESLPEASRWDLLLRATKAEAAMEAILVRLASQRRLREDEIGLLQQFRQIYQSLREAIRDNQPLAWDSSDHPKYLAFKRLATGVTLLILSERTPGVSEIQARADALQKITAPRSTTEGQTV